MAGVGGLASRLIPSFTEKLRFCHGTGRAVAKQLMEPNAEFPGLLALIDCDADGEVLQQEGENTETLASILLYTKQMAELIGASLGLEAVEEARIMSKSVTAVCIPREDGAYRGALFEARAKIDAVLPKLSA